MTVQAVFRTYSTDSEVFSIKKDILDTNMDITTERPSFSKVEILDGLKAGQFEVYYQPVVDMKTNSVDSGEALVRWNHPERGLLYPASFIPASEENNAIIDIGDFVLRQACTQSKAWKDEGCSFFKVAVNISVAQLVQDDFISKISATLADTKIDPSDLELEITETMAITNMQAATVKLNELEKMGIKISLDDFGAGYSSLNYLRYFPVNSLKIDGQFVQQSLRSDRDAKFIQSIILLAHSLGLHIVAEGVETKEQLALLKEMECSNVQGFYFSQALPSTEYKKWCTNFIKTSSVGA